MKIPASGVIFALLSLGAPSEAAVASVSLTSSIASPAPLGAMVRFTATANASDPVWYRFRVREAGNTFHTIKDFGPDNTLDWTASEYEGTYEVQVDARTPGSAQAVNAVSTFHFLPLATGDSPVITPTNHPMVYLYSAPACAAGLRIRVRIDSAAGFLAHTPYRACQPGKTMNFYLAGLRADAQYSATSVIETDSNVQRGTAMPFSVSAPMVNLPTQSVQSGSDAAPAGILLQASIQSAQFATDLNGNLLWYYPSQISYITRPEPGGRFFGLLVDIAKDQAHQLLREFDLAGMTLRETNAARVNEQLAALGKGPISGFHHEARALPGGNILVLAGVERIMNDVQDPGPVDILGDMIIVLDKDLQVVWTWDAFDHLDVTRKAVLRETCPGGCTPLFLAPQANDWLHGNSVQLTPDGNLLYSARHQDWVIKIDYQNGAGTGDVIWRFGKGGDFLLDSMDPNPWFSHQHDPQILPDGSLALFDNGNIRNVVDPSANSRGQVYLLDEANRLSGYVVNADLGIYSFALGAAQRLQNGNYHFLAGWIPDGTSLSMEVTPIGEIVYALHTQGAVYRSFRMPSLYEP